MDQGDMVFRPSSKGESHLTLTWKVGDGIFQHVDVREEGKENAFSLGHKLWINNEEYEDLDEITARFVQPLAAFARELLYHKYFQETEGGNRKKMERNTVIASYYMCGHANLTTDHCGIMGLANTGFHLGANPGV